MPRSRRRHHSRSRSRSRSHSHERDREPKRRKIESYDSPHHKRSVSSQPEAIDCEIDEHGIDETDQTDTDLSASKECSNEETIEKCKSDGDRESKDDLRSVENVETSDLQNKEKNEHQLVRDTRKENSTSEQISASLNENKVDAEDKLSESDIVSVASKDECTNDNLQLNKNDVDNDRQEPETQLNQKEDVDKSVVESVDSMEISDDESTKNTPTKLKDKANDLKITPKKVLSPKQLLKKRESEKKRQERQKEKEEKERKRLEEREQKLRLKQEKEEQRIKEKLAKEERKKKEQEERDKKRREKEEKEEQKKKEREQEKLKKQQEIEEKNKEKQKLEEQKQKTAAAFANFFLLKKCDFSEEKKAEEPSKFMPFEVKSDMRLAPISRKKFFSDDKMHLDQILETQDNEGKLYLDELKQGKEIGKSAKTWAFEDSDQDDDIVIVEEGVGEAIVEQKSKFEKMRAKFFKFHENQRPPYFGTFKKKSKTVNPRRPFSKDDIFNYEVDSDEEWEEEGEGESLKGTDDENEKENENESENDYEVDNDVFVPHGHLSGDERDDEENVKFSPESHKAKLKLLKNEFDEEMKSKLYKIKPRVIGCIWYNKSKSNVEEAIDRYLQPFSIICNGQIEIKKRSDLGSASFKKSSKQLSREHVPLFLKLIHGSMDKKKNIVKAFIEHMTNNGIQVEVSQLSLGKQLKSFAQWQKCPEEGAMYNKMCWYVGEDVRKEYNVNLILPTKLNFKRKKSK